MVIENIVGKFDKNFEDKKEETDHSTPNPNAENNKTCDTYMAILDPDVMDMFRTWTDLSRMNDVTLFFLLIL